MALMNTIFNCKAYHEIGLINRNYASENERGLHFKAIITRLSREDETAGNYIDIPIGTLLGENLEQHLGQSGLYVLESFGLESRSRFPNYGAIRELLNTRFCYDSDDSPSDSPFKF